MRKQRTHRQGSETDGAVAAESQALRPWAVPAGAPAPVPVPRPATSAQRKPAPVTAFVPHKHPDYPDGPDLDPMLGARTPAFVEFLSKQR